jgi:hypothetical protein
MCLSAISNIIFYSPFTVSVPTSAAKSAEVKQLNAHPTNLFKMPSAPGTATLRVRFHSKLMLTQKKIIYDVLVPEIRVVSQQ